LQWRVIRVRTLNLDKEQDNEGFVDEVNEKKIIHSSMVAESFKNHRKGKVPNINFPEIRV
jgi:hypothetical protein